MKTLIQRLFGARGFAVTKNRDGWLKSVVQRLAPDHVVDVGANRGQFASTVRRLGYGARMTCFEPIAEEADQIPPHSLTDIRRILLNDGTTSSASLNVYSSTDFSSVYSLTEDLALRYGLASEQPKVITVPASTLDEQALEGSRVFLKVDTQGSELSVLKGGKRLLSRVVAMQVEIPFLLLYERSPQAPEIFGLLAEAGFGLTKLFPVTHLGMCIVDADAFFERTNVVHRRAEVLR